MEEESKVDPKSLAGSAHFGEALVYDFAKFLTSLSLLALGGVLSLTQAANKQDVKPVTIAFVLGTIALAGALSTSVASRLVDAAAFDKPAKRSRAYLVAAVSLLGIGTGGFLAMWWDTLK